MTADGMFALEAVGVVEMVMFASSAFMGVAGVRFIAARHRMLQARKDLVAKLRGLQRLEQELLGKKVILTTLMAPTLDDEE